MSNEELNALIEQAATAAEGEVVTRALSRDVALPHTDRRAVLITLDNGQDHTRPNTIGPRGLAELNAALDTARARDDISAILVTGKPFILAAGADLSAMGVLSDLGTGTGHRADRPCRGQAARRAGADVRPDQQHGARRRAGGHTPLRLPHRVLRPPGSPCRSASWAWSRAGAERTWSPT